MSSKGLSNACFRNYKHIFTLPFALTSPLFSLLRGQERKNGERIE